MLANEAGGLADPWRFAGTAELAGIARVAFEEVGDFLPCRAVDRGIRAEVVLQAGHRSPPVIRRKQRGLIGHVATAAFGLVAGWRICRERHAVGERREGSAEEQDDGDAFHVSVPRSWW